MNSQDPYFNNAYEKALAQIRSELLVLKTRVENKRVALQKSDAAINALPDLVVAAANGDVQTEGGSRLTIVDAVKGASELRQIHQVLVSEIAALEEDILKVRKREHVLRDRATGQMTPMSL